MTAITVAISSDNSINSSNNISSEEEFTLPPTRDLSVRQYPDYLRRRVNVPCSYFNQSGDDIHGGVCRQWGRYRNSQGTFSYGYYIYFDAGDRYWLLESDVHKYLES